MEDMKLKIFEEARQYSELLRMDLSIPLKERYAHCLSAITQLIFKLNLYEEYMNWRFPG